MEILKYFAIALLSVTAIVIIGFMLKSGRPFKYIILNAVIGLAAIFLVDITSRFTGVHIPINEWTVSGSAGYGIPAVCGFLILQLIFGK